MGIAMEVNNAVWYCDHVDLDCVSDLTDTENDEYAFERVVPRSAKRTYGVFVDSAPGEVPEQRKRSRIDEQLELLRAAIPKLCTNEKASILAGAYEYIEKLQKQVQDLNDELDSELNCSDDDDNDDESSCEDDLSTEAERPVHSTVALHGSCAEYFGGSHPMVEVTRNEVGLKIHIECEKKPRVLADIMELLESSGMNVEHVSIAYQEDSQFVFDCVGSDGDGKGIAAVEACLWSLIADQRDSASPVVLQV